MTRILVIGNDPLSILDLMQAIRWLDMAVEVTTPVVYPPPPMPVVFQETRFIRDFHGDWAEPTTNERIRLGKGEKRRLKKQRGW
ncbi:hypothetical protein P9A47_gp73 [Xanthomonas phage Elanor]|uniref:Uncharacterized protein n=1 Tax=Xanthomonas phage Elanor TaxID=2939127 RepID=A0A9E7E1A5_9CAUD|nr:hypothetical protein P9A47_gp73 [Xanthomonas phage Elanor]URA07041.1 hypothetical protein Elanor_BL40073 [Xanthomonas phage Elanor]